MKTCAHAESLAAYMLGTLDADEIDGVNAHLAECGGCRAERDVFAAMMPCLQGIELEALSTDRDRPSGRVDEAVTPISAATRRSARRRWAVAAAGVAAVALPALALAVPMLGERSAPAMTTQVSAADVAGGRVANDPATGVRLRYKLGDRGWGTHVAFELGGVTGTRRCELVAVSKTGERVVAGSWLVPAKGYGVSTNPTPLRLHGQIALQPSQIAALEVTTLDGQKLLATPV